MQAVAQRVPPRVTLLDGTTAGGALAFFSFEQKVVDLKEGDADPKRIAFHDIAIYRFSQEQGLAEGVMPAPWRPGPDLSREPALFKGKLRTGKIFSGRMRAYLCNSTGAFLVIPSNRPGGADSFIFIPEENIAELKVDEPLGAMLVKNGTLTEEAVAAVLEMQKTLRFKPLGGYLANGKALTADQLTQALGRQKGNTTVRRIGEVLVGEQFITEEQLSAALEA